MYESKPLGNLCRQVNSDTIQPKWKARGAPCCINLLRPLKHGWKVSKWRYVFPRKTCDSKKKSAGVSPNASFRDVDFGEWRMLLTWHCEKGTVVSRPLVSPRCSKVHSKHEKSKEVAKPDLVHHATNRSENRYSRRKNGGWKTTFLLGMELCKELR